MRASALPVLYAALAGVIAYTIGSKVLGHEYPFFAPIGVWACLGFTANRRLRRVAEMAVGVALGVGFGTFAVHFIGSGAWQIALVMCIAVLASRFIDGGVLLATQAGTQSIVIVGLPHLGGGPVGRWSDAMVGGAIALLAAALMPGDLRRQPRALGVASMIELSEMLALLAKGLSTRSVDDVEDSLLRGRSAQRILEDWLRVSIDAQEASRVAAHARKHRPELIRLRRQAVLIDRAMRTLRVLARRAMPMAEGDHDFTPLLELITRVSEAIAELSNVIARGGDSDGPRRALRAAAALADPGQLGMGDWQVQSLMMLMRSPIVDVLEAAGCTEAEAHEALPAL